jgi:hypothetical protein
VHIPDHPCPYHENNKPRDWIFNDYNVELIATPLEDELTVALTPLFMERA